PPPPRPRGASPRPPPRPPPPPSPPPRLGPSRPPPPLHTGGDHLIVVGRVRALGTADDSTPDRAPLLFHRGRFGRLRPEG
ncbi:hypothetical protein ACFWIJ_34965, partial [Streptomyces sp. NPDC127079]